MGKYHNQDLIKYNAKRIKESDKKEYDQIIKNLKEAYGIAKDYTDKITPYTAPEEENRLLQSLYYYQDLARALGVVLDDFHDEEDEVYVRKCSECGKEMTLGYCIESGMEYYCSDECLHKHYTEEEWQDMYEDGGDSYWTNWEE